VRVVKRKGDPNQGRGLDQLGLGRTRLVSSSNPTKQWQASSGYVNTTSEGHFQTMGKVQ
jgi:hypothetical protein